MRILLYIVIGLTIGSASGAMGIGGGVLLVPALVWLCGFTPARAAGTSLAVLVPPIGLPAAYKYYLEGRMDASAAVWIAAAFVIGAYLGASVIDRIPEEILRLAFGALISFVAMRFMLDSSSEATKAAGGLTAFLLAWLTFHLLRTLGRKHLEAPDLGEHIRAKEAQGWGDPEYQI
jgi:uncharacterized membrane protein YfcA